MNEKQIQDSWKSRMSNFLFLAAIVIVVGFYFTPKKDAVVSSSAVINTEDKYVGPGTADIEILKHSDQGANSINIHHTYATVRNNAGRLASFVNLEVVYYDEAGKVVGTGMGIAANIAAGTERVVTCSAADIYNAKTYMVRVSSADFR